MNPMSPPALDTPDPVAAPVQPHQTWQPPPPPTLPAQVRRAMLWTAVTLLILSVAVAFYSANAIVSIWFQHQWVPVARLVLSVVVAGLAFLAVRTLLARKA